MTNRNSDTNQLLTRVSQLKSQHSGRSILRKEWKALRRGIDPRYIKDRALQNSTADMRLRTNDSVTYFDLVTHMLSGRDVGWKLASRAGESPGTLKDYGTAEAFVSAILQQNNNRLLKKGGQRMERAFADSIGETGTLVYTKHTSLKKGVQKYKVEVVNPTAVYERFDDEGLAEIVHVFRATKSEITKWDFVSGEIKAKIGADRHGDWQVDDYYEREFDTEGEAIIRRGVLIGGELAREVSDTQLDEIPFEVLYSNGEAFPDDLLRGDSFSGSVAKSILDANRRTYTDIHDFLGKLESHMGEVLTAPVDEFTFGGQPVGDVNDFDPTTGERQQQPYDTSRGENGRRIVNIPQLDQSTNLLFGSLEGQRQRGSVSDLLHGNLNVALSGFAISQVLEAALSAAAETKTVMELAYNDIGKWIIDTFRDSDSDAVEIEVDSVTTEKRSFFYDDVKPSDMPKRSVIKSNIVLAVPSDLTERVNNARTLDPSGGPIVGRRGIQENLLTDLVPDVGREAEDLRQQRLEALPEYQTLEVIKGLLEEKDKAEEDGDTFRVQVIEQTLQTYMQMVMPKEKAGPEGGPQAPEPQGEAGGIPPTSVLPTAQRTRGAQAPQGPSNRGR